MGNVAMPITTEKAQNIGRNTYEMIKVGTNSVPVIEWNGQRVITTAQLAEIYEASETQIKQNYGNNEERFNEGEHYYLLKGQELKAFKNQVENFYPVNKHSTALYLWTRRGASRHCKMLGTDKAWEQFDELEENYYNSTRNIRSSIEQGIAVVKFIADDLRVSESSRLFMYENYCKDVGIPTGFLPKYEDNGSRERCSVTELLKRNGCNITPSKFNNLLIAAGYLKIKERKSSTKGMKQYKSLTDKGLKYGVNLICNKNQKETQPYYYADTFMELFELVQ